MEPLQIAPFAPSDCNSFLSPSFLASPVNRSFLAAKIEFSYGAGQIVNLLALRLQWFESTPTQASPRAILQVLKPFGVQLGISSPLSEPTCYQPLTKLAPAQNIGGFGTRLIENDRPLGPHYCEQPMHFLLRTTLMGTTDPKTKPWNSKSRAGGLERSPAILERSSGVVVLPSPRSRTLVQPWGQLLVHQSPPRNFPRAI
jgi:hypothetical protein